MIRSLAPIAALAALALTAPVAHAAKANVHVLVVGKSGVLRGPKAVALKPRKVEVDHRRCAVGAATPLSVLAGVKVPIRVRDLGSCGRRARDAGGLYVVGIAGRRAQGRAGWVYKVGRRAGTSGAADPAGPFGTGRRLRRGDRVLWFWCRLDRAGGCPRTLEVRPQGRARPGRPLRVTVRGYDDHGRGAPVAGATVRLGRASATTDARGVATVTVPDHAHGRMRLRAHRRGTVPAFPTRVVVR